MVPQYTYRDYRKFLEIIKGALDSYKSDLYKKNVDLEKLYSIVSHYIFGGTKEATGLFSEPVSADIVDTIPKTHSLIAMILQQPYKKYMYEIPFEDLPLEMNSSYEWAEPILKWRFSIGK